MRSAVVPFLVVLKDCIKEKYRDEEGAERGIGDREGDRDREIELRIYDGKHGEGRD